MAGRWDSGETVNRVEQTAQGGLRIPTFIAKPGILVYNRNGKPFRELRPASEVFHADSLASLADAPVTLDHPEDENGRRIRVNPENFREFSRGHLSGPPRVDENKVAGEIIVNDAEAVAAIAAATHRHVSAGYDTKLDLTPGTDPEFGPYDGVQRHIRYNHIAIVTRGRAGGDVSLRLDSEDEQTVKAENENKMTPEQIQALIAESVKAALAPMQEQIAQLEAGKSKAEGEAAGATLKADEATKALEVATDPARTDAAAEERADIVSRARTVLGRDYVTKGKTNVEIMREALGKRDSTFKTDSEDATNPHYVRGRFDSLLSGAGPDNSDTLRRAAAASKLSGPEPTQRTDAADPNDSDAARERMLKAKREQGSAKLAYSRT